MFDALTVCLFNAGSGSQDRNHGVDNLLPRLGIQDRDLGDQQIPAGCEQLLQPSVALGA